MTEKMTDETIEAVFTELASAGVLKHGDVEDALTRRSISRGLDGVSQAPCVHSWYLAGATTALKRWNCRKCCAIAETRADCGPPRSQAPVAEGELQRAIDALLDYQQADMDGIMVLTSRQAIHEVVDALNAARTPTPAKEPAASPDVAALVAEWKEARRHDISGVEGIVEAGNALADALEALSGSTAVEVVRAAVEMKRAELAFNGNEPSASVLARARERFDAAVCKHTEAKHAYTGDPS